MAKAAEEHRNLQQAITFRCLMIQELVVQGMVFLYANLKPQLHNSDITLNEDNATTFENSPQSSYQSNHT